ncbi:hypothetical protein FKW77_010660 [Venturia effusa]|uniref:Uncharacterized protein n=1 Tax=Venturia effusa TaxID=50376 RepID=A0A517KY43_9PEZI|nr:hypothetical protein FKW77_010660 [Venturia effusa]
MNGYHSSPPSIFGRTNEDDNKLKDHQEDNIAADAQQESPTQTATPSPAESDVTEMPSTPSPPRADAGGRSVNGPTIIGEPAVEREDEMDIDPKEEIQMFDWENLQQRYHQMIEEQGLAEDQLEEEFSKLINFFTIWLETTRSHEVDRSFKRLKTRVHHVRASEEQFEERRMHYLNVVAAFKSALALLNQSRV